MDRQNSTSPLGITNFLQAGALLRHRGQWTLIEGPFKAVDPSFGNQNNSAISVYWPDFYDLDSAPFFQGSKAHNFTVEELKHWLEPFCHESDLPQGWQEPAKEDFATSLSAIQNRISSGQIQKAVPVVFARSNEKPTPAMLAKMILNLLTAPPTLYVYGFWQNGEGILGATPEVLFDFENHELRTMALAGTCPKSEATSRTSLLNDAKEMEEHLLVVEDLQQRLSQWGDVKFHGPEILELPTLYHLKTDFFVKCETTPDFFELTKTLHPTPALGVAPRSAGYQWMADLPGQTGRRGFGGPFGFFSDQKALCLVAIRNMQWNKERSQIGSGCGVVKASELEREWRELFQKRLSVKKILGIEL